MCLSFLCCVCVQFFFFNDTATTEIYTLSLHDALPIWRLIGARRDREQGERHRGMDQRRRRALYPHCGQVRGRGLARSEEHTSELQSRQYLVCRLLLEKKKKTYLVKSLATHIRSTSHCL